MWNARFLFLVIMVIIVTAIFVILKSSKDLYRAIPADLNTSMQTGEFDDWREFVPNDGSFTVQVPAIPQYTADTVVDPKSGAKRRYDIYIAEKGNGNLFMITMITYPSEGDLSNPEDIFQTVIDETLASNTENQLVDKQIRSYQNHKTLDFTIQNPDIHTACRAFIIGRTLYLLSYIAKNDEYNVKEFDHFVDSFSLTPSGA